jgi:hypothetical protein
MIHDIFIDTCRNGNLIGAKTLLSIGLNINTDAFNIAFSYACYNEYLEVAQWLLSVKPDININIIEEEFIEACLDNHLEIAKWIVSLNPYDYILKLDNNQIVDWGIRTSEDIM